MATKAENANGSVSPGASVWVTLQFPSRTSPLPATPAPAVLPPAQLSHLQLHVDVQVTAVDVVELLRLPHDLLGDQTLEKQPGTGKTPGRIRRCLKTCKLPVPPLHP